MKLLFLMVISRMRYQKRRMLLVLLAIAAASCLVSWMIGGYRTLFSEAIDERACYLGHYDLRIDRDASATMRRRGMGGGANGFFNPLSTSAKSKKPTVKKDRVETGDQKLAKRAEAPLEKKRKYDPFLPSRNEKEWIELDRLPERVPEHIRERLRGADLNRDGFLSPKEEASLAPVSRELQFFATIEKAPEVILADKTTKVRAFLFSKKMASFLQPNDDEERSGAETPSPQGVDPELYQAGMKSYRASLGTPVTMGQELIGTTAKDSPFELKEGRWLRESDSIPEAVLTEESAKRFHVRVGDDLLAITRENGAFQMKIVGISEGPEGSSVYVTYPMAERIQGEKLAASQLWLRLDRSIVPGEFKASWLASMKQNCPDGSLVTEKDLREQRKREFKENNRFEYQAISGTLLAVLASIFIIFATLTMGVDEQKRQLALYRAVGLTRGMIGRAILLESIILTIPGWLVGLMVGWFLLYASTGKYMIPNGSMILFSFLCAVAGAAAAAVGPIVIAMRIPPIDLIQSQGDGLLSPEHRRWRSSLIFALTFLGLLLIALDLVLVYGLSMPTQERALYHSGIGILALIVGVAFLLPILILMIERFVVPILALIFRFDPHLIGAELSSHLGRTLSTVLVLSVGIGLFAMLQIWGYSMLGPFLPGREIPDTFAAYQSGGLSKEWVEKVRALPSIHANEFLTVAVEQAAFARGSVKTGSGAGPMGSDFANVVFFGVDLDRAFGGESPMFRFRYLQGKRGEAIEQMRSGRGCLINDAVLNDYGLTLGDRLRVQDPERVNVIREYSIVGVIEFPGWQWLSKTGNVRRHFGRSGGIVFVSESLLRADFGLDDYGYFWFNTDGSRAYPELESAFDQLAKEYRSTEESRGKPSPSFVKLSTRASLAESITKRADSVIWGLSTMPLVTLVVTSLGVVTAISASVRSRRRSFGLLRAAGVPRGTLIRMILVEAISIGLAAFTAGLLFGGLAAAGALRLGRSMFGTMNPPLLIPYEGLAFGLALMIALCLVAAIVPAVRMGMMEPAQLLESDAN